MHNADNYIRYLEVAVLTLLRDREERGGIAIDRPAPSCFDSIKAVKNDFPPTAGGSFTPYNIKQLVEKEMKARREGRRSFGPCIP